MLNENEKYEEKKISTDDSLINFADKRQCNKLCNAYSSIIAVAGADRSQRDEASDREREANHVRDEHDIDAHLGYYVLTSISQLNCNTNTWCVATAAAAGLISVQRSDE